MPTPCPVDGVWSEFGPCEKTTQCGVGTQTRTCTQPQHGGAQCDGGAYRSCTTDEDCPVAGGWGAYGACDATCGRQSSHCTSPVLLHTS